MRNAEKETICAIATGTGNAGIGIVRLSGPDAIPIAERLFRGRKKLSELKTYTAAYGHLVRSEKEEILDEAVALVMRAPHSYTTEDVVEFSCHGGALTLRRVLEELVLAGARLAEPGEFTKRAYLGGRIDLSEAEAVMDVIAAESDAALDASLKQLNGSLRSAVTELREKLLYETAYIESALDDPENYSLDGYPEHIAEILSGCRGEIRKLLSAAGEGRLLREGIRTAIVGRPNAGKSSILNLLLGEERAIVTEIAGTTRDTLEEKALIGGVQLVLVDTAGIRETEDRVEQLGVRRARETAEGADLILLVIDASDPLSEEDRAQLKEIFADGEAPVLVLLNKNDLNTVVTAEEITEILEQTAEGKADASSHEGTLSGKRRTYRILEISAATGEGKELLAEEVRKLFFAGSLSDSQERYMLRSRHIEALHETDAALSRVEESVASGMGEDFYTIDLLAAYESLGRITGETLEDDLADKIFAEFCMGK